MNKEDRAAWAKKLKVEGKSVIVGQREEAGKFSAEFTIPGRLPSKANTHEIRFQRDFWKCIEKQVEDWRAQELGRPYWIGPSEEVKNYEEYAATIIALAEKGKFSGDLELCVEVYGQRLDVDNGLKVLLDAIQKSGVIDNDKQFVRLIVTKIPATEQSVKMQIRRV